MKARVKGELEAQVIPVERSRLNAVREGSPVGPTAHREGGFLASEVPVAALLQTCLGNPLEIEEADHVGEERSLGIDPLGVGLEIEAADAEVTHPLGRVRIEIGGQLDAAAAIADGRQELLAWLCQHRGQACHDIGGGANALGVVPGEVEVTRMSPQGEAFLIERHQPAHPIDDRAPLPERRNGMGLDRARLGLQTIALQHLEPGKTAGQPKQGGNEEDVDRQQATGRQGLDRNHTVTTTRAGARGGRPPGTTAAAPPRGMATGGGGGHQ